MGSRSRRPRRFFARIGIFASTIFVISIYTFATPQPWLFSPGRHRPFSGPRMPTVLTPYRPLDARIPCIGPRGQLLSTSPDDDFEVADLDIPYPVPTFGTYDELNLSRNWMTPSGRYGAYGYGEHGPYDRLRVAWDTLDWGFLQQECFRKNIKRFPPDTGETLFDISPRFTLRDDSHLDDIRPPWDAFNDTRRTAVLISVNDHTILARSELHHLRSLIVEAGLQSGGEHTVILLVRTYTPTDEPGIFSSQAAYDTAFAELQLPDEFKAITVLWDEKFLRSWYPQTTGHRSSKHSQLLQLFALHYPEFDYYWHVDHKVRITCDAGELLDSLSTFARAEPRKQALERASFRHMQRHLSTYSSFLTAVNSSNGGGSHAWGPLSPSPKYAVIPIGPTPPVSKPKDDMFEWGVGEDADLIVTASCSKVQAKDTEKAYSGWGLRHGQSGASWWSCPPAALIRTSRALLLAAHAGQLTSGLTLPDDSALPMFVLWHGLKLSAPPLPTYVRMKTKSSKETEVARLLETFWGGGPRMSSDGFGKLDANDTYGGSLSYWWSGDFPDQVMKAWYLAEEDRNALPPQPLVGRGGEVYMPGMVLYPVRWRSDED